MVDPVLSDHAIIRYLSRIKKLDMTAIEEEIKDRILAGESLYDGAVVIDQEGYAYIRRPDGFIKTVVHRDWLTSDDIDLAIKTS